MIPRRLAVPKRIVILRGQPIHRHLTGQSRSLSPPASLSNVSLVSTIVSTLPCLLKST